MKRSSKFVSTVTGAAALALIGGPVLLSQIPGAGTSMSAFADEAGGHKDSHSGDSHSGGKKGGKGGGGDDAHGGGKGGAGGKSIDRVYRGGKPKTADEDSGKRGPKYGGGKQGSGGPTGKGDLFGDLFVLKRNPDGTAVVEVVDGVTYVYILKTDGTYLKVALDEKNNYVLSDADKQLVVEVELSRLNSSRSPKLLDQRYAEMIALLNDPNVKTVTTDATGRMVITYLDGTTKTIDSPVDSLALYTKLVENGYLPGLTIDPAKLSDTLKALLDTNRTAADLVIAAALFAAASDKYLPLSADAVVYLNRILKLTSSSTVPVITDVTGSYIDYAALATNYTYDRSIFDVVVKVAVNEGGTVVIKDVNLKDWLNTSGTISTLSGFDAFVQAIEDTRLVIAYIHDHQIPAAD